MRLINLHHLVCNLELTCCEPLCPEPVAASRWQSSADLQSPAHHGPPGEELVDWRGHTVEWEQMSTEQCFKLTLSYYNRLLSLPLMFIVYSSIPVYFIPLVLPFLKKNKKITTLHRWEVLVSKHFKVKTTPVVFGACDKQHFIWFMPSEDSSIKVFGHN